MLTARRCSFYRVLTIKEKWTFNDEINGEKKYQNRLKIFRFHYAERKKEARCRELLFRPFVFARHKDFPECLNPIFVFNGGVIARRSLLMPLRRSRRSEPSLKNGTISSSDHFAKAEKKS